MQGESANANAARCEPAAQRWISLDAIRGVAVMGILAMNIVAFALPMAAYFNPLAGGAASGADIISWAVNFILVDSKMRGLFSILFGASTLLVIERAQRDGASAAASHYQRMGWLALIGAAHYYLIWAGDILTLYAACGLLLFLFRGASVRALWIWAGLFLFIGFALMAATWGVFVAAQAGSLPPEASAGMAEGLRQIAAEMGPDASSYARDLALYRGGYGDIVAYRTGAQVLGPLNQILMFGMETMAMMLIGMALFRMRMLTGEWDGARYRRWALVAFAIGVPVQMLLVRYQMASGFDAVAIYGASLALSIPFDIMMAVGWAALIMWWLTTRASAGARDRLAATGRMAFTNYLATSVLMTLLFYGYGAGLFGSLARWQLIGVCLIMWALMLWWSRPWLARHPYGPMEWLWRSLSRRRIEPWRR